MEVELKSCRENLERVAIEKECLQRQSATQLLENDRLRQEKESLEMHHRVKEREVVELREKLVISNKSVTHASNNIAQQESTICQMTGNKMYFCK